ncbi:MULTISPECIES: Ycf66 family protein [unclassified Cyanobium]|uniref:Ycf66 family protein n=1 Tax=unclassified Cyanobium TaxID=2627006 RepID=UPI0020CF661D|nr:MULTISPECIES: Ycf66 family protein [unclassified Cyanobium]MCP9835794.1 hypothetical protein [Cyanobium sp. La Preciosa 7G6]MCP9938560.1 hypothetical protein [Cyanobium sp. Aljojuca 7A6]
MLATLGGFLALLLGLLLLLLPLLASELSRARDSVWGAVVLLLGLVLVTSAERLTGAPMLAVLCGGLLIGRLGVEVGQGRWRLLSEEERQRLWSVERWQASLSQLGASLGRLLQLASGVVAGLGSWLAERRAARPASTKRWVRPEAEAAPAEVAPAEVETPAVPVDDPPVVSSFEEIDTLLEQAIPEATPEAPPEPATPQPEEGLGEAG